jgi:hypothetical protein
LSPACDFSANYARRTATKFKSPAKREENCAWFRDGKQLAIVKVHLEGFDDADGAIGTVAVTPLRQSINLDAMAAIVSVERNVDWNLIEELAFFGCDTKVWIGPVTIRDCKSATAMLKHLE